MPKVSTATSASARGGQNYINHGLDEKQDWNGCKDKYANLLHLRPPRGNRKSKPKTCSRDYQDAFDTK
jgi:hypothetical protein